MVIHTWLTTGSLKQDMGTLMKIAPKVSQDKNKLAQVQLED